jgi:hypothetical protein
MNAAAAALLEALENHGLDSADAWTRVRRMLETHADTAFGRHFDFGSIHCPEDFRKAVPPMDYEDHRHWIERAAGGETGVLACDQITGFERTSGSTSQGKWIPLTAGLRQEFAHGMAGWLGAWKRRCPAVFNGRAYWAISPPGMMPETTSGGLPVGMTGDAAYFPDEIGEKLERWMVIPELSGAADAVFDETAAALLGAPDLSLVSVWSPTFLLGIDSALRRMRGDFIWRDLWPKLALVSCWADGASAPWIPRLMERLGGIPIEGKGLLATEGITSIPDATDGMPRLATECHWHEFISGDGVDIPVSRLRRDGIYQVLLTTGGGLYRYRSGDLVRVTGMGADGLPRLQFIGRSGVMSDLVGEKLHENQVIEAMAGCGFMVADPGRPGYDMWLEDTAVAGTVEAVLRCNVYLDQAMNLRQLAAFRVRALPENWMVRLASGIAAHRGCRMGDVKPCALLTGIGPEEVESWLD